jgi:predicted nucleic acid-binding protein
MQYLTIDSSVFVAAIRQGEEKQESCKKLLQKVASGEFKAIEPYTVLVEVTAAIRRRTGSIEFAERIKNDLLSIEGITFEEVVRYRAEEACQIAAQASIRGMDAVIVQIAKENKCTLVTLDDEMAEKVKGHIAIEEVDKLL